MIWHDDDDDDDDDVDDVVDGYYYCYCYCLVFKMLLYKRKDLDPTVISLMMFRLVRSSFIGLLFI